MIRAKLTAVCHAVPDNVLTNDDLAKIVDTSDEWIVERTGIRQRRILRAEQSCSDLAAAAGAAACRSINIDPQSLDAIIVGTVSGDRPFPATAAIVQKKIGAGHCPAFDINAACSGFVFSLGLAESLIIRGGYRRILVVGAEVLSRWVDWTDRATCVLFGDGAGAAIVEPSTDSEHGILDIEMHTDGSAAEFLDVPAGGSAQPASIDTVQKRLHYVQMSGRQVFAHAVRNMASVSVDILRRNGFSPGDVTTVFAHQANLRVLEGVSQRTEIPFERFFNNIDRYGNTSAASIPIAMSEALAAGRIKSGDLILLTALGAGFSWGSALIRW